MHIYDKNGTEKSLDWLHSKFGPVAAIPEDPRSREVPHFFVAQLHEVDDNQVLGKRRNKSPASITVIVLNEELRPIPGAEVVFWWPDAPKLDGAGHHEAGASGKTDSYGQVTFPTGDGAFYNPQTQAGPHKVWIYGPGQSQRCKGLGMVRNSNHRHLDVVFQRCPPDYKPDPSPDPQTCAPPTEIYRLVKDGNTEVDDAILLLTRATGNLQQALTLLNPPSEESDA